MGKITQQMDWEFTQLGKEATVDTKRNHIATMVKHNLCLPREEELEADSETKQYIALCDRFLNCTEERRTE